MMRQTGVGMNTDQSIMEILWTGPYSWPKYESESGLPSVPKHPGLYLQTFEFQDGYLISAAGLTRRPIPTRLREHTTKFISGDYTIMDMIALKEGIRKEVWHGWGWSPEKRTDFEKRKLIILSATRKQLAAYRMFVANVDSRPRILERLEASIWNMLYKLPNPLCDIPDRGVMISPRWETKTPIIVKSRCKAILHGLQASFHI